MWRGVVLFVMLACAGTLIGGPAYAVDCAGDKAPRCCTLREALETASGDTDDNPGRSSEEIVALSDAYQVCLDQEGLAADETSRRRERVGHAAMNYASILAALCIIGATMLTVVASRMAAGTHLSVGTEALEATLTSAKAAMEDAVESHNDLKTEEYFYRTYSAINDLKASHQFSDEREAGAINAIHQANTELRRYSSVGETLQLHLMHLEQLSRRPPRSVYEVGILAARRVATILGIGALVFSVVVLVFAPLVTYLPG